MGKIESIHHMDTHIVVRKSDGKGVEGHMSAGAASEAVQTLDDHNARYGHHERYAVVLRADWSGEKFAR